MLLVGLLGNKIGMTHIFNKFGEFIPITIIKGGPCFVTQIKINEKLNYNSVQLGYKQIYLSTKKLTKANLGHFLKNNSLFYSYLTEYKIKKNDVLQYSIGQKIDLNIFKIGQKIKIIGSTIGKGTAGNIKKNHFHRGPMSHGSKHHRLQGSIGSGTTPGRVIPGKKMSGRLGMTQQTISNLEIIDIDLVQNLLVIKGSVPGKVGNLLKIIPYN